MRVYNRTSHPEYTELVHSMTDILMESLFRKVLLWCKLRRLTVTIKNGEKVKAHCKHEFEFSGELFFKIYIEVPETDVHLFEFVFAHELMHLLFTRDDLLNDFSPTDDTYAANTTIQRMNGTLRYGREFEEMVANYMALRIMMKLNGISCEEAKSHVPDRHLFPRCFTLAEMIIEAFDDTFEFGLDTELYNRNNPLLFEVCESGNLSSIIQEYDLYMGKGSWMDLMISFENYANDKKDEQSKKTVLYEVERFNRIKNRCSFYKARDKKHKKAGEEQES